MDILGFLIAAATAAAVAMEFGPVVAAASAQWRTTLLRVEVWVTYALAAAAKRLLGAYAVVFLGASIVVIHTVGNFNNLLSGWVRMTLVLTVLSSIAWMGVTIVRLWDVSYASFTDVWSVGTTGGPTRSQFRARYGRRPRNPLRTALLPIFTSSLAFAATCVWIKFEAAGVVESSLLLPVRMASGIILSLGLALSIAAPIAIGYYVAKAIDPFSDAIVISVLRAVAIAAPGITGDSFDRLTSGDNELNIPLEKLMPAVIAIISPPIAILLTLHGFAMWVGDGFVTAYLSAFLSVAGMAGFSLWAFGVPGGDWPKKVIHALWGIVLLAVVVRFFIDVGAPQAVVASVEPHRGWFETQWVSLCNSFATSRNLIRQDWGFVKGVGRGLIALILGPVLCGAIAGGALDSKSIFGKVIGFPIGFVAIIGVFVGLGHVLAILLGWFTACAS